MESIIANFGTINPMRIAIIGGGFTGLAAAYELTKAGNRVTVLEKEPYLGGLAYGFRAPTWAWHIEAAYHHMFTNDSHILELIRDLGLSDALITKRPITSTLWNGRMYQLDSPMHLLRFPGLSPGDKIRTAALLGFFKFFPFWRILEQVTAEQLLISIGGKRAWETIWEPLLYGKFGVHAPNVSASWFWARIVKRTPRLCYIRGGFHTLILSLRRAIVTRGGVIRTGKPVSAIRKRGKSFHITYGKQSLTVDRVLLTIPTPLALSLLPELGTRYAEKLTTIPHLSAQTLILETDRPILTNVYWLNVTDKNAPFLAAVAHTNFMEPSSYGGRHLTYFGNYLPQGHPYLSMTKEQLLTVFLPYIRRIAPHTNIGIRNTYLFTGPFAQPVHERRYSQKIPPIPTPIAGVYLANMDYIVPWDRGTNYAVELGQRAARIIHEHL